MLSRSENEIMRAVYDLCDGTDGCLVSPVDILCLLPPKRKYDIPKIDSVEKMYVINLKESGMSYKRMIRQRQRDIAFRIALAFVGALATFLFGLIIRGLFG